MATSWTFLEVRTLRTLAFNYDCDHWRVGRLVWITAVAGVLVGVAVLHAERLVRVLVAELEFTPPTELALLCIREDFTGRERTVPRDLCDVRSEEHTSELQSLRHLVCR